MSGSVIEKSARVAADLQDLQQMGFLDKAKVDVIIESLPILGQANWAWDARAADEITFSEDASIVILKRDGEWWTGMREDGTTGLFPHNYVKILPYPPVQTNQPQPRLPSRTPSANATAISPPSYKLPPTLPRANSNSTTRPPPTRGASSLDTSTGAELNGPRDYKATPLKPAYVPSLKDRGESLWKSTGLGKKSG
ncbi:Drebrins and related actin binding proteins [Phaffia rhodozyma]|uniref:Drebrins and related actin binding proteins n=1 Tax=Phaffia rhodozyma TaxID=264483 RepID=A0A0F7SI92_PHARH|nr:Drebrins and related actin binding proteins [Phaffia rhodozyma]